MMQHQHSDALKALSNQPGFDELPRPDIFSTAVSPCRQVVENDEVDVRREHLVNCSLPLLGVDAADGVTNQVTTNKVEILGSLSLGSFVGVEAIQLTYTFTQTAGTHLSVYIAHDAALPHFPWGYILLCGHCIADNHCEQ